MSNYDNPFRDPAYSSHHNMYQERVKPGDMTPQYEDIRFDRNRGNGHQVATSRPWWNPRYWTKKIWAGLAVVLVIVIVVAVAVGVTQSKKSSYPDYKPITYSLKDTCEWHTGCNSFFLYLVCLGCTNSAT